MKLLLELILIWFHRIWWANWFAVPKIRSWRWAGIISQVQTLKGRWQVKQVCLCNFTALNSGNYHVVLTKKSRHNWNSICMNKIFPNTTNFAPSCHLHIAMPNLYLTTLVSGVNDAFSTKKFSHNGQNNHCVIQEYTKKNAGPVSASTSQIVAPNLYSKAPTSGGVYALLTSKSRHSGQNWGGRTNRGFCAIVPLAHVYA